MEGTENDKLTVCLSDYENEEAIYADAGNYRASIYRIA